MNNASVSFPSELIFGTEQTGKMTWGDTGLHPKEALSLSAYLRPDFPRGSDGKASVYNAGDPVSIPGSGRSPGEGNGSPLQYSCLGNPVDRGAWQATVNGTAKESDTTE